MLNDIMALTRACRVTLPTSVTTVARGIVAAEGDGRPSSATRTSSPSSTTMFSAAPTSAMSWRRPSRIWAISLRKSGAGALDAANYSGEALKMLTRGQLKMNMDLMGSDIPFRKLSRIFTRITLALIVAGLFIGSSLLSLVDGAARSRRPRVGEHRLPQRVFDVGVDRRGHLAQEVAEGASALLH